MEQQIQKLKNISETMSSWIDGSDETIAADQAFSLVIQKLDNVIYEMQNYGNS